MAKPWNRPQSFPLRNCLIDITTACLCKAIVHNIPMRHKGYLLLILQHIQSYLKTCNAMQCNGTPFFISLGLDGPFIPQAKNGEWGMWKMCPPHWRSSSKKNANWRFWKSTNLLLLSNIANPTYCFIQLPTDSTICLLVVLFLLWRFSSYLPFRLDFCIVLILNLNPKFVQKLYLNLKLNYHLPLKCFMYLSR